jgi:hypothetical protein
MEFNLWLSKINNLDNKFLINKHHLINFIQLVDSKFLTLEKYDKYLISDNKKKLITSKNDCIFIWDCEFQVFKAPKSYSKNNKMQYEIIGNAKMIRCISEIGLIILFNIKNIIYFVGVIHISFLNKYFQEIKNYLPFYHEYMSVNNYSAKKIINIENSIYPHLMFEKIWNKFKYDNNDKVFQQNVIKLLKNNIIKKNKSIYEKFNNQLNELINLLENGGNTDKIINKIIINLKNIIYNCSVESLNKTKEFTNIRNIYLNDKYIQSILVDPNNHNIVINDLNIIFSTGLNIIKGTEDIKAIQNHNILLNNTFYKINKIIDIADYNSKIYDMCGSAKLYESYLCLNNLYLNSNKNMLNVLKKWMESNFKPHNPLVDAYYTLQVFILYNKNQ